MKKLAGAISIVYSISEAAGVPRKSELGHFVKKVLDVVLIWMFTSLSSTIVKVIFETAASRKRGGGPLKGIMQVIQIIIWCIGLIVIISVLVGKSPAKLLTGLGASIAVLSFVFKDTIMNFVAGILLTTKMLKWATLDEVPTADIDGENRRSELNV